jgi:conjugal transfer/entry exclusion protein
MVTAMGGDPTAGWRLNERFTELGLKVDALQMGAFRLRNATEHAQRLAALRAAQMKAEAEAEAAERRAQEEARRHPLVLPPR